MILQKIIIIISRAFKYIFYLFKYIKYIIIFIEKEQFVIIKNYVIMNAKRINDDKKYRLHEGNIKGINILQVQILSILYHSFLFYLNDISKFGIWD